MPLDAKFKPSFVVKSIEKQTVNDAPRGTSEGHDELAVIQDVGFGLRNSKYGRPTLWFRTKIKDGSLATQKFTGTGIDDIVHAYNLQEIHDLEGEACIVTVNSSLIVFKEPFPLKKEKSK